MTAVVMCAVITVGSGFFPPQACQKGSQQTPMYQVRCKLVCVDAQGNHTALQSRKVLAAARQEITVWSQPRKTEGRHASYRFEYGEESEPEQVGQSEDDTRWRVQLDPTKTKRLEMRLSMQSSRLPGNLSKQFIAPGIRIRNQQVTLQEKVRAGEVHRVVLTQDGSGLPTSWVEVDVEPVLNDTKPDGEVIKNPNGGGDLYPFWYEPF